ncbi:MAG: cysteine synthase [Candidatus Lokiarchaeota archaeon]|nr:cysteine synthase [Candidatus Lokiarchaeota archaeon]
MKYYKNILKLVGKTPLVKINVLNPNPIVNLYAKLENFNPSGSVKARVAVAMIEQAENDGTLTPEKIVIEPSSGNTGIALAMCCAVKGYACEIVMPEHMSIERRKIMVIYGAKVTLTPAEKGTDGAIDYVKEIVKKNPDKYFFPDQFSNKNNPLTHYNTTAQEIIDDTDGEIDYFISGMGTSGTLMGVSKKLKEFKPRIKIIAVEPEEDASIPGLKSLHVSYVPEIYDESMISEEIHVSRHDAEHATRMLALQEGIFCGISSGAAMHIAMLKAKEIKRGTIVVLFPDSGVKYVSDPIFMPDKCLECAKICRVRTLLDLEYIKSIREWWS